MAIPLLFIILAMLFAPITKSGELDPDEGVNLAKALLVSRGYRLYTDIWSDQAPLMTITLGQWIRWFGTSVVASRILILLFSALLLWAFYQTIRLSLSELPALVGVAFLLLSAWYVRLSIAVMIGLPAVALAMLSIYLVLLAQMRRDLWLTVASGVVLAASLQTKLFTGILVPVILVYLLFVPLDPGGQVPFPLIPPTPRDLVLRKRIGRCAVWLAAFVAGFVVMTFIFRSFDPSQLVAPHLDAGTRSVPAGSNLKYVGTALLRHAAFLPLAIIGLIWSLKNRKLVAFLPLGWFVMALAFLLFEKPVWYHHVVLLTIPLVWLSAFGIEAGLQALRRPDHAAKVTWGDLARTPKTWVIVCFGAVIAILAIFDVFDPTGTRLWLRDEIPPAAEAYGEKVIDLLCPEGRAKGAWVFTDRPFYAFRAGLAVPPPIAVLTVKRLSTGTITDSDLVNVLLTYRPKYVLLERYLPDYGQEFLAATASMYELALEYSEGWEGPRGQLLVSRPPDVEGDADTDRPMATARFADWLSFEWNPAFSSGESQAGNCVEAHDLKWTRPETFGAPDLALSIRLADQAGEVWAQHDEALGSFRNTLRDQTRLPYFVSLYVPEGTPPGIYDAQLVVYEPHSGQPLPVTSVSGERSRVFGGERLQSEMTVGVDRLVLGQVHIAQPVQGSTLRRPLADFGSVRLVEAETPATKVSPGDSVPLSLLWQAGPDFGGESLVVVAQLLDEKGKVVASLEEEPLLGRYPSTGWRPRELVRDRHSLSVPQETPPGRYELIVGLYTLPERSRLKTRAGFLGLAYRDYFPIRQVQVGSPPS